MHAHQKVFTENAEESKQTNYELDGHDGANGIEAVPDDAPEPDGEKHCSIIRQEGDTLVERHESTGPRNFVMDIVREVTGGTMLATTSIGGISMKTIYKRT
ncbi:hypothetical protein ElyMa_001463400 [Elysia marginata]|uniref:Uncharacterized protein n=1 Tax=Elysia marginata TaxID=1093978 RepID=A0AAV4IZT8_9GAST|nr:hypothetical protein ElyMa_001463400 [Elysia marginata]